MSFPAIDKNLQNEPIIMVYLDTVIQVFRKMRFLVV